MRTFTKMTLALGLVALLVAPAAAQAQAQKQGRGRGGMFGGGAGATSLLTNEGVQKELKVNEGQASKLDTLAEQLREKQREAFQGAGDLSDEQRREKMMEVSRSINSEMEKKLGDILEAGQVKRFRQIQLQSAGVQAFMMPRVLEDLKLSDDQRSKIREIAEDQREEMTEVFRSTSGDREAAMKKMADLRKKGAEKALAVLTDGQKKSWNELTGEPFEVKMEAPRRRNNN